MACQDDNLQRVNIIFEHFRAGEDDKTELSVVQQEQAARDLVLYPPQQKFDKSDEEAKENNSANRVCSDEKFMKPVIVRNKMDQLYTALKKPDWPKYQWATGEVKGSYYTLVYINDTYKQSLKNVVSESDSVFASRKRPRKCRGFRNLKKTREEIISSGAVRIESSIFLVPTPRKEVDLTEDLLPFEVTHCFPRVERKEARQLIRRIEQDKVSISIGTNVNQNFVVSNINQC